MSGLRNAWGIVETLCAFMVCTRSGCGRRWGRRCASCGRRRYSPMRFPKR